METIKDGDTPLAIIYRDDDWSPGLHFPTPDELFIQAGCWHYDAGKSLAPHAHKEYARSVTRTQEVTYVRAGSIKVTLYDERRVQVRDFVLHAGDFAVMCFGGHGYEILEDGTQVLEVKNGPFISPEADKERF